MNTILGIFDSPLAARQAMESLRSSALHLDDVSLISRATESGEALRSDEHISAGEGAALGVVWGGLVGLATFLIPGIGPFIAGGALLAGITGAATGAVVGGIAGALIDSTGISTEEAHHYESLIHEGKTLIAVKANDEDTIEVRRILVGAGAESIRDGLTEAPASPDPRVHVAVYDQDGGRIEQEREYNGPAITPSYAMRGIYDVPPPPGTAYTDTLATQRQDPLPSVEHDPYATRKPHNTAPRREDDI